MSEFVINGDMFGEYVRIPTGYSKDMHVYKVVCLFNSNAYCEVPLVYKSEPTLHKGIVPVVNVIHCGIDETKVERVALSDCEPFHWGAAHDARVEIASLQAKLTATTIDRDAWKARAEKEATQ